MRKKLTLNRETLRNLETVFGGLPPTTTYPRLEHSQQATCRQTCAFTYCRQTRTCAEGRVASVSIEV